MSLGVNTSEKELEKIQTNTQKHKACKFFVRRTACALMPGMVESS